MDLEIGPETFERLANVIHSDESPVGIDAKKTHVLIIHLLLSLGERLDQLERRVAAIEAD